MRLISALVRPGVARPARALAVGCSLAMLAGCGAASGAEHGRATGTAAHPGAPALSVTPLAGAGTAWRTVASVHGQPAAWQAHRSGVMLLRFDQRYVRVDLHAGTGEPKGSWPYGGRISPAEIHSVIAAFNGGFKFGTGVVGWMYGGRVAEPLAAARGSIVTYTDGTTAIGAWRSGVPSASRRVLSVLQSESLLIDHGTPAPSTRTCVQSCWGPTLGRGDSIARSALGEAADGSLVWAAGEQLTPYSLASALAAAGAQRAVELDINPEWVAAYLYVHGGSGAKAVPVVPGQYGIQGQLLAPYGRDFFAVVAR